MVVWGLDCHKKQGYYISGDWAICRLGGRETNLGLPALYVEEMTNKKKWNFILCLLNRYKINGRLNDFFSVGAEPKFDFPWVLRLLSNIINGM
ncbi:MAG: hypothetical protein FDW93_03085 [Bergeyella sp.]|nr:hypothetical protein [Bergeyella sp.]